MRFSSKVIKINNTLYISVPKNISDVQSIDVEDIIEVETINIFKSKK